MHSRQCPISTDPATCLLTQPFPCLPSHLPVDPISTFFSSNVVPGHRRASARTSLINSAHPGPARLARALELGEVVDVRWWIALGVARTEPKQGSSRITYHKL